MRNTISIIFAATVIVAVSIAAGVYYLQSTAWLKNASVDGCMKAGVNEYDYGDSKAKSPNMDIYKTCMKEKGYK